MVMVLNQNGLQKLQNKGEIQMLSPLNHPPLDSFSSRFASIVQTTNLVKIPQDFIPLSDLHCLNNVPLYTLSSAPSSNPTSSYGFSKEVTGLGPSPIEIGLITVGSWLFFLVINFVTNKINTGRFLPKASSELEILKAYNQESLTLKQAVYLLKRNCNMSAKESVLFLSNDLPEIT